MTRTTRERFIGALTVLTTSLITFLVAGYFSGFALRSEVELIDQKYESRFDKVLVGLCIIDERTCKLKE